ncbi:MAG TPA: nuclear transport factor 2 family protein [Mycobacteriales bacterium]|nr:nuclear transport factor 2 family protein [Mycobacteriales bacterium]
MVNAHEQIRNLLGRYCELIDAGDFAALAELFASARLCDEHGNAFATGGDEIRAMWDRQTILYDGSPCTRHITANPILDVDDSNGTATARSSYVVFQATDDLPLQPIASGRYADTFSRGDDGDWQWVERRYTLDHAGDLSHHLRRG